MSKLKQRYLKEVKSFFPIMGKPERRHLKKLSEQINDYCIKRSIIDRGIISGFRTTKRNFQYLFFKY